MSGRAWVTLRKLADRERDQRRAELAEAYQAEALLGERRGELAGEIRGLREESAAAAGPGTVDVERLLAVHRHLLVLDVQQQALARQADEVSREVERRRAALVEADRRVRMLENLAQRRQLEQQRRRGRQEQRLLDEAATIADGRRRQAEGKGASG